MWESAEGSTRPEMSVALIFGWMKGAIYRLAQLPNMKARGLDLEQPPKIMPIERRMANLLERLFRPKSSYYWLLWQSR